MPFFTENYEGFDINHPEDLTIAMDLVKRDIVCLPSVLQEPWEKPKG
jgi:hypothetical protein